MFTVRSLAIGLIGTLSIVVFGLWGFGQGEEAGQKKAPDKTAKTKKTTKDKSDKPGVGSPASIRKFVRSVDIEFDVAEIAEAAKSVDDVLKKYKGSTRELLATTFDNGVMRRQFVVLVPVAALESFLENLREESALGTPKGQKLTKQDITKQYADIESELKAARTVPDRLLEIIKERKAELKDLVLAETELGVWRAKVEKLEGSVKYWDQQLAYSAVTIVLAETAMPKEEKGKDGKPAGDERAKPLLEALAAEKNAVVRKRIVIALSNLEGDGARAIPPLFLLAMKKDEDLEVRTAAQTALKKFKATDVVDALMQGLRDTTVEVAERRICCKALPLYYTNPNVEAEKQAEILRALEDALADEDAGVRVSAALALEVIAPKKSRPE